MSLAALIVVSTSFAKSNHYAYKHWKIWRSAYGYEFKYPRCWVVEVDSPEESQIVSPISKSLSVTETAKCKRAGIDWAYETASGLSISPVSVQNHKLSEREIYRLEKTSKLHILRGDWGIFKETKVGSAVAVYYVRLIKEVNYKYAQWEYELLCPSEEINVRGPAIKITNGLYSRKFKAGDLALPEPEKTIYASIKCVHPKALKRAKSPIR